VVAGIICGVDFYIRLGGSVVCVRYKVIEVELLVRLSCAIGIEHKNLLP
jgi:hypothetical protein